MGVSDDDYRMLRVIVLYSWSLRKCTYRYKLLMLNIGQLVSSSFCSPPAVYEGINRYA